MSVKLYDTLEPQGEFPAAKAEDIELKSGNSVEDEMVGAYQVHVGDNEPTDARAKLWVDTSDKFALDKMDVLADYQSYSEEEVVVGKYKDGKPIYRRTLSAFTVSSSNAWFYPYSDDFSSIETMVMISGVVIDSNGTKLSTPYYDGNNIAIAQIYNGKIYYKSTLTDGWTHYITIEYTKTTDAEDSFKPSLIKTFPSYQQMVVADFEDYSTAEKVIGRWIDGKPIYRKELSFTVSNSETSFVVANDTTIDKLLNYYGVLVQTDTNQTSANYAGKNFMFYEPPKGNIYFCGNSTGSATFSVEYTKTTDTENSFDAKALASTSVKLEVTDDDISYIFGGDE